MLYHESTTALKQVAQMQSTLPFAKQDKMKTKTIFIAANWMIYFGANQLVPILIFIFTNYTASLKCNRVCYVLTVVNCNFASFKTCFKIDSNSKLHK